MQTPTPPDHDPEPDPDDHPRHRRLHPLDLATAVLCVLSLVCAVGMMRFGLLHGNDFKHLWLGSWLLAGGGDPYDPEWLFKAARNFGVGAINPYVYLPTTGLFMRPLTRLSPAAAMLVFFWFNWALAWAVVFFGPGLLRVERPGLARLAGAAFVAGSLTFFRQQTAGQMNVVAAALILGAAGCLIRNKNLMTGLLLALGFGWKIAPAFLIAALAPLRRWRALGWGVAFSVVLLGASVAVYGIGVHRAAIPVLRQMGYGQSTWAELGQDFYRDPANQSPNSFFHHILTENPHTQPWLSGSPALANGLTIVVSLILFTLFGVVCWKRYWRKDLKDERDPRDGKDIGGSRPTHDSSFIIHHSSFIIDPSPLAPFLAASLLMLLLPSLMWDHYAVQVLPALLFVFGNRAVGRSAWRAALAIAIFIALAVPVAYAAPAWHNGIGIVIMSLRLWPMLGIYVWLLCDRRLAIEQA